MSLTIETQPIAIPDTLMSDMDAAVATCESLLKGLVDIVYEKVAEDGRVKSGKVEAEQRLTHGLAWFATYVEALKEMRGYSKTMSDEGRYGEMESLVTRLAFAEYLAQIFGGIPMTQGEIVRLADFGVSAETIAAAQSPEVARLMAEGNTKEIRTRLVALMEAAEGSASFGDAGLDETMEAFRDEMNRFAESEVTPNAHEWHLKDAYIPMEIIEQMAEMGVFGLTIPEDYGGLGLGKESMCVVSEALSRAFIGVGSLGTRSEIAAELILCGGTEEQKEKWLPMIASGEILPTAVFTEPNTGSDLASLKTRATLDGDTYKVTGNKTWITHPVRADLMTLMVRTNPAEASYKGLSMLLAEKPRGDDDNPFPAQGMDGGEIEVLGYRGMKEYDIAFDNFEVSKDNLLGGEEGQGFKQLMQTFEAARIQTAARAIGVAQNALDLGLRYAQERVQFGKSLINFPRVIDKLAMMAAEIMVARQLTYYSARQKDHDKRCDLEAGMAKLLGARVAWAAADNALQIHGGNGFALEYAISRVLCDARVLNIFEGAGEIQAQVIARRLLDTRS